MKIPEKFTINTQEITVEIVDQLQDQRFGEYNSITDTIRIAKCIKNDDGEVIKLKEEQILNSFFHELLHVFQWHCTGDTSETESSTYAGYFIEFIKSSGLTIN